MKKKTKAVWKAKKTVEEPVKYVVLTKENYNLYYSMWSSALSSEWHTFSTREKLEAWLRGQGNMDKVVKIFEVNHEVKAEVGEVKLLIE